MDLQLHYNPKVPTCIPECHSPRCAPQGPSLHLSTVLPLLHSCSPGCDSPLHCSLGPPVSVRSSPLPSPPIPAGGEPSEEDEEEEVPELGDSEDGDVQRQGGDTGSVGTSSPEPCVPTGDTAVLCCGG